MLSYCHAVILSYCHTVILSCCAAFQIDEVSFRRPVEIGSLLQFESKVLFTAKRGPGLADTMHVEVIAYVTDPVKKTSHESNTFYFTFAGALDCPLPRVLPG
jgi:acyl-coenzyme A thioesterase 9